MKNIFLMMVLSLSSVAFAHSESLIDPSAKMVGSITFPRGGRVAGATLNVGCENGPIGSFYIRPRYTLSKTYSPKARAFMQAMIVQYSDGKIERFNLRSRIYALDQVSGWQGAEYQLNGRRCVDAVAFEGSGEMKKGGSMPAQQTTIDVFAK